MGRSKKKKTASPVAEETVTEPEAEPAPDEKKAEWLIQQTMSGVIILCSCCHAQLAVQRGTLTSNLLRNKYCYNCGCEMIVREI